MWLSLWGCRAKTAVGSHYPPPLKYGWSRGCFQGEERITIKWSWSNGLGFLAEFFFFTKKLHVVDRWMCILDRAQGNMSSLKISAKCVQCVHWLESVCLFIFLRQLLSWGWYVSVDMYIYTYTYTYICTYVYVHIYMYICICTYICTRIHICTSFGVQLSNKVYNYKINIT